MPVSPVVGLKPSSEAPRARVYSDDEPHLIARGLEGTCHQDVTRLILATGIRITETMSANAYRFRRAHAARALRGGLERVGRILLGLLSQGTRTLACLAAELCGVGSSSLPRDGASVAIAAHEECLAPPGVLR